MGVIGFYGYYMQSVAGYGLAEIDKTVIDYPFSNNRLLNEGRVLVQLRTFFEFLTYSGKADLLANILLGSTLFVPFAVYTFDVVAAARRRPEQGVA